jgi:hypothetical protein
MTQEKIFCRKCGKETDSDGRFCQWCKADITLLTKEHTVQENSKDGSSFYLIFGLITIIIGIIFIGMLMTSHTSETIKNITVVEKYPYQYRGPEDRLVDENGHVYYFHNTLLWAKLKVNQTYEVRVITEGGQWVKYIDATHINDVWYY